METTKIQIDGEEYEVPSAEAEPSLKALRALAVARAPEARADQEAEQAVLAEREERDHRGAINW